MTFSAQSEPQLAADLVKLASERDAVMRERDAALRERDAALRERDEANIENKFLRAKVDALIRRMFGVKSEHISSAQMVLMLQEVEAPGPALGKESGPELAQTPRSEKKPQRRDRSARLPANAQIIEEILLPEPVKMEPQDWRKIGEEVNEQFDYEPARFLRRRVIRPKYVSRKDKDAAPIIAPLPPTLQERCTATPSLIAHVVVSKYCAHLPLYRQESLDWSQHGVWLPRQNRSRWVGLAADWLKPIYQSICGEVMADGYVQIDETPIKYLAPGEGKTRQGYLWVAHKPGGDVAFHWHTSRATACLDKIVPTDFTGTIQCDGYAAYPSFAKSRAEQIRLASCWAHIRRGFFEALAEAPRRIGWFLLQIKHLYEIEEQLRENRAGPKLCESIRQSQSAPIIRRIYKYIEKLKQSARILPQSGFGKALDYALNQRVGAQLYLSNGRVHIDNNPVERAIRPTAVGKKNWLFFGDADAGERGAIIYTIIESCRRHGIDPYEYLRDVLTRLPSSTNWQIKDLTPAAWAIARRMHNGPIAVAA